jgi:hypothetical protein
MKFSFANAFLSLLFYLNATKQHRQCQSVVTSAYTGGDDTLDCSEDLTAVETSPLQLGFWINDLTNTFIGQMRRIIN